MQKIHRKAINTLRKFIEANQSEGSPLQEEVMALQNLEDGVTSQNNKEDGNRDICTTRDDHGRIVAVTRCDAEGRILEVIAEA